MCYTTIDYSPSQGTYVKGSEKMRKWTMHLMPFFYESMLLKALLPMTFNLHYSDLIRVGELWYDRQDSINIENTLSCDSPSDERKRRETKWSSGSWSQKDKKGGRSEWGEGYRERDEDEEMQSKKEKWIKCERKLWRRRSSSSFEAVQVCFLWPGRQTFPHTLVHCTETGGTFGLQIA